MLPTSMVGCMAMHGDQWQAIGRSQDIIGWRRFMEGMISKEIIPLQRAYLGAVGSTWTVGSWAKGLIVKLLEVTHGQWLYRNLQVHDDQAGALANRRKEELQLAIEEAKCKGMDGLDVEDRWLMEVRLDDLDETSGEDQEYWLLAYQAALEFAGRRSGQEECRGRNRGRTRA